MRNRLLAVFLSAIALTTTTVQAQSGARSSGWSYGIGVSAGLANVPSSADPVYFSASSLATRLVVRRDVGNGLSGGLAFTGTLGVTGSDCVMGPCAPQFKHHALAATLSYARGNSLQQWIPMATVGAGVARMPEQWAISPNRQTTSAQNSLLLNAALDVPVYVRSRTALLVGWESGLIPNTSGGRVTLNALVLSMRFTPR
jgi:hypothetical protein